MDTPVDKIGPAVSESGLEPALHLIATLDRARPMHLSPGCCCGCPVIGKSSKLHDACLCHDRTQAQFGTTEAIVVAKAQDNYRPPLGCSLGKRHSIPPIHRPMLPLVEMKWLSTLKALRQA